MTKSNYLKNYAESFAIFAKYEPSDTLGLDYRSIAVDVRGEVSPEDHARLIELGWSTSTYRDYYRDERGNSLGDYS